MSERTDYVKALSEAIDARRNYLEKSEAADVKDKFRAFQTAYTSLYALLLKKGLIKEDPYKGEAKMGEIVIPPNTPFSETESMEQISIRLAGYDTQLDFLANFYQLNVDFFTLEQIKLVLGLVKYIDWVHLSASSESPITAAVGSLINRLRSGADPMGTNVVNGVTVTLNKLTGGIMTDLKALTDFAKESYKLELRMLIIGGFPENKTPTIAEIKKKFGSARRGKLFYTELAEEVLKEDYSPSGAELRQKILKALAANTPKEKPKTRQPKQEVPIKPILIEGIQAIGSVSSALTEIGEKLDENEVLMEHRKIGLWNKIKRAVGEMLRHEPEPVIYEIEFNDGNSGTVLKERVNFTCFRKDLDKKAENLANAGKRSPAKLEAMPDDQLTRFLETAIKDVRAMHRVLSALDDYFKAEVDKEDRNRVKGIKPELATIKNAFIKASEKFTEYSTLKAEEDQFKRMGIDSAG
ncbi:MAG: hypothetical protein LBG87_09395 [Spirochaetaceae bacterium]|jgi:hypothetical protein|nr:hypothetical protein [Spirochaetaceae bacterium]